MDQAEKDRLVKEFCSVSNVDEARALFFLESSHWELDIALGNFYENNDGVTMNEAIVEPENVAIPASAGIESNPTNIPVSMGNVPPKTYTPSRNFASIHDYKNKDDDDSEEEGQRFYAGGSEHSGELIVGPKSKSNVAIASNLFKQAKTHGAEVVDDDDESPKPGSSRPAFSGSGYRLGDSSMPSESVTNPANQKPEANRVILRLWSNGFTVDDGDLRSFQDPDNREFLGSIAKGEIPKELVKSSAKVHLNMEDHRNEEYKKVKPKMVPFSGTGYSLSSGSPSVEASSAAANQQKNSNPIVVDKSKPKTTVQIRLVDGSRVRQEFNHSHTVADVQAFVAQSSSASNFVLMTTFPNHELKDLTQTLVEANLLNSSIVQKMA